MRCTKCFGLFLSIFFTSVVVQGSNDWYYTDPSGRQQGPFSDAQMQQWSKAGYFTPDTLVQHGERGLPGPISQSPLSIWPDPGIGVAVEQEHRAVLTKQEEPYSNNRAYFRGMTTQGFEGPYQGEAATTDDGYLQDDPAYSYDHYAEGKVGSPVYDYQDGERNIQRYQQPKPPPYNPPNPSKTSKAKKVMKKVLKTWLEKKALFTGSQAESGHADSTDGSSWQNVNQGDYRQQSTHPYYGSEADDTDYEYHPQQSYSQYDSMQAQDDHTDVEYDYPSFNEYQSQQKSEGFDQERQSDYSQSSSQQNFESLDSLKDYARGWYDPNDLGTYEFGDQDQWGQESEFVEEDFPPYYEGEGGLPNPKGDLWDPHAQEGEFTSVDYNNGRLDPRSTASTPPIREADVGQFQQGEPGWVDGFGFDHEDVMDEHTLERGIQKEKERQLEDEMLLEERNAQAHMYDAYLEQENERGSQPWAPDENGAFAQYNGDQLRRQYDEYSYYPDDKGYERQYEKQLRPELFQDDASFDGQDDMDWTKESSMPGRVSLEDSDDEGAVKRFLKGLAEPATALLSRGEDDEGALRGTGLYDDMNPPKTQPVLVAAQSLQQLIQMHPLHSMLMVIFNLGLHTAPVLMALILKGLLEQMITVAQAAEIGTTALQLLVRAGVKTTLIQETLLFVAMLAGHTTLKGYLHPYLESSSSTTARLRLIHSALSDDSGSTLGSQIWRQDLRATACAPFQQAKTLAAIIGLSWMMILSGILLARVSGLAALVTIGTSVLLLAIEVALLITREVPSQRQETALESTLLESSKEAGTQSSFSDLVPMLFNKLLATVRQNNGHGFKIVETLRKVGSALILGCVFVFTLFHITKTETGSSVGAAFLHLALYQLGTVIIMNKLPSIAEKSVLASPALKALNAGRPESTESYPMGTERLDGPDTQAGLEAQAVWYSHPTSGSAQYALQAVSLRALPGEVVVVVGPDGAGKSTLSKLLQGRARPDRGQVAYQGRSFDQWATKEIRRRSVCVDQGRPYLSSLTIKELVGLPCLEKSDLEDASAWASSCSVTGAYAVAQNLPQGLDTPVGEAGLSEGQWQRFMLTRPFLKPKAELVVLDDPAAHLPEAEVMRILADLRRNLLPHQILIIFSPKVCIGRLADNIIYLEDGKVMEEGQHIDLMALGGRYSREMKTQCSLYSSYN